MNLIETLHRTETVEKGHFFLEYGKPCEKIGQLKKGILRGFVMDNCGEEITTHFYQEGDVIIGSYLPNIYTSMTLQALEDCVLSVADYSTVMSYVNKDKDVTDVVSRTFQKLNSHLQARLVALQNLDSTEKYQLFLEEYPTLVNRIPHYYIANFLGITPTQLSRARKRFIDKCI